MKPCPVLSCLGLILAGCSTTYDVPRDTRTDAFEEARESIDGRSIQVTRVRGAAIMLDSASLIADTIAGLAQETCMRVALPLTGVNTIMVSNSGRGILRGTLQGAAIVGGSALVLGIAVAASPQEGLVQFDAGAAGLLTLAGVVSGALLGGVYGAVGFSTYTYTVDEWNEDDSKPSKSRRLFLRSFQDETPGAVCIAYRGKLIWLPKSEVKIERDGEYILLTVPERLLDGD